MPETAKACEIETKPNVMRACESNEANDARRAEAQRYCVGRKATRSSENWRLTVVDNLTCCCERSEFAKVQTVTELQFEAVESGQLRNTVILAMRSLLQHTISARSPRQEGEKGASEGEGTERAVSSAGRVKEECACCLGVVGKG